MTITKTLIPAGNPAGPGDYTLMSTAEAADQQTLAEPYVLECYAGTIDDYARWTGWGTSAVNNVLVKDADGQGHGGVVGGGLIVTTTTGISTGSVRLGQNYTVIQGITCQNTNTGSNAFSAKIDAGYPEAEFRKCILISGNGTGSTFRMEGGVAENCLLFGNRGVQTSNITNIANCTAIDCAGRGFFDSGAAGSTVTNFVSYNSGFKDFDPVSTDTTYTNCASGDGTAPGVGAQINIPESSFVDYPNGDYSPAPAPGVLAENGADLSANFTTDIAGNPRTVPWTIGAYALPSAAETADTNTFTLTINAAAGTQNMRIKVGAEWVNATPSIKVGSQWVSVDAYVKVGAAWVPVYEQ